MAADEKKKMETRNLSGDVMHDGKIYPAGAKVPVPSGFPSQDDIEDRLATASGQQPMDRSVSGTQEKNGSA